VKFVLDAHLPPVLARVMAREGYEVVHVFDLDMNAAADPDIWKYAGQNGYVLISKDEDFVRWQEDASDSPSFIWVRTGNCKNKELIDTLLNNLPAVVELLKSGSPMVEIFRAP
jgi:predicted nuclease of predicted toxin-antitoxin system